MSDLRFDDADFAAMKRVEHELVHYLLAHTQTLHPILVCFTLIRCARVFLRKGDRPAQAELAPLLASYLQGHTQPPGSVASPLLWTQPTREQ